METCTGAVSKEYAEGLKSWLIDHTWKGSEPGGPCNQAAVCTWLEKLNTKHRTPTDDSPKSIGIAGGGPAGLALAARLLMRFKFGVKRMFIAEPRVTYDLMHVVTSRKGKFQGDADGGMQNLIDEELFIGSLTDNCLGNLGEYMTPGQEASGIALPLMVLDRFLLAAVHALNDGGVDFKWGQAVKKILENGKVQLIDKTEATEDVNPELYFDASGGYRVTTRQMRRGISESETAMVGVRPFFVTKRDGAVIPNGAFDYGHHFVAFIMTNGACAKVKTALSKAASTATAWTADLLPAGDDSFLKPATDGHLCHIEIPVTFPIDKTGARWTHDAPKTTFPFGAAGDGSVPVRMYDKDASEKVNEISFTHAEMDAISKATVESKTTCGDFGSGTRTALSPERQKVCEFYHDSKWPRVHSVLFELASRENGQTWYDDVVGDMAQVSGPSEPPRLGGACEPRLTRPCATGQGLGLSLPGRHAIQSRQCCAVRCP